MQKVQNLKIMNETKDTISNTEIIFNVKEKQVFDLSVKKAIKRKADNLPESSDNEEDNNIVNIKSKITPIFTNVKSFIYRYLNKNLLKDIKEFKELPEESEYFMTITNGKYLIYRS